ncbi:hypothetical protein [Hankyongella ginsenosidimutans]|uniref:hypothetical protein n=1 Tax=Hankyongella ginsenosidimutans TaxID=1763828 RepID=UPI001FEA8089|nr:hypothetical protein [Hankyongella ginsenosidimutans]
MTMLENVTFGPIEPAQLASMSGLELMQAMIEKRLPAPTMARTLNFWLAEVGEGWRF